MPPIFLRYTALTLLAICLAALTTPIAGLLIPTWLILFQLHKSRKLKKFHTLAIQQQEDIHEAITKRLRDLHSLKNYILETGDIPEEKAIKMAHHIAKRYTSAQTIERQKKLGITDAEWVFTDSDCGHAELSGKRFKLVDGMQLDSRYIFPAESPDCNCRHHPLIPEFE